MSKDPSEDITVSVVIPCFNEEGVIERSLHQLRVYLDTQDWGSASDPRTWEIVPVDDGSTDSTAEKLRSAARTDDRIRPVFLTRNLGQGGALQAGFNRARGKWVICFDADLDYEPDHLRLLLHAAEQHQADIVVGSVYARGGTALNVPPVRLWMSRMINWYYRRILEVDASTFTSILRIYRREALQSLLLVSFDKELLPEILVRATLLKYRVVEIPARLKWDRDVVGLRGRGFNVLSTIRKAGSHLVYGFIENPFYLIRIPLLVTSILTIWLSGATLIGFFRSYRSTSDGLLRDISSAFQLLMSQYSHTFIFLVISIHATLILFFAAAIVLQNRHKRDHDYIMMTQIAEMLRRNDRPARTSPAPEEIPDTPAQREDSVRRVAGLRRGLSDA